MPLTGWSEAFFFVFYKNKSFYISCSLSHSKKLFARSNLAADISRSISATSRHCSSPCRILPIKNSFGVVSKASARRITTSSEGIEVARSMQERHLSLIAARSQTSAPFQPQFLTPLCDTSSNLRVIQFHPHTSSVTILQSRSYRQNNPKPINPLDVRIYQCYN